ncbi:hypothetical protein ABT025_20015 [Streptomyces sp. NPDC002809]|uniref:hypothetical protein n=1 Tax=Streptomyces sp. NPDC002809 TaxID=3154433 RepID=UPI00332BD2FE
MRITVGDGTVLVTGRPLCLTPRFDFRDFLVRVAEYSNVDERGAFLLDTFGSGPWLWDTPDELRFDREGRELVGAEFQVAGEAADPADSAHLSAAPAVHSGGLRAAEVRDFRLEVTTELCRAPEDAVLTCLRDLGVLAEPLEARVGIAPDVALLVQDSAVAGWSLTDPVRYVTTGFAAPDPAPPAPSSTRDLFTTCMDLVTTPCWTRCGAVIRPPCPTCGSLTAGCATSVRTGTGLTRSSL